MLLFDLLVNAALIAIEIVVWRAVHRERASTAVACLVVASLSLMPLVAAGVLTGDLFAVLRVLAWISFVHVPLVLGWVAWRSSAVWRGLSVFALVVVGAVGVEAFVRGPTALEVTRYTISSPKVDAPLRIAVLSDLQTDDPGAYERRALRIALDSEPDLILLPGDYVQHRDPAVNRRLREQLRQMFIDEGLQAPLGVHAVRGNVEHDPWREIFAGLPVHAEERTTHRRYDGVSVTALSFRRGFDREAEVSAAPGFHIAFAHGPDFALGRIDADLLVAGHTHGGQVRLPWIGPLITMSSVPRAWAAGRTSLDGGRTLIVSRGIGMERDRAPRLRFLCPPEVVLIEVVPEA